MIIYLFIYTSSKRHVNIMYRILLCIRGAQKTCSKTYRRLFFWHSLDWTILSHTANAHIDIWYMQTNEGFHKLRYPPNGWCVMNTSAKMDDLWYPYRGKLSYPICKITLGITWCIFDTEESCGLIELFGSKDEECICNHIRTCMNHCRSCRVSSGTLTYSDHL